MTESVWMDALRSALRMRWLAGLSGRQHVWMVLVSAVGLLIVVVGAVHQQSTVEAPLLSFAQRSDGETQTDQV